MTCGLGAGLAVAAVGGRGPSGLGRGVAQAPRRYRGGGAGCADDVEQRLFYPARATPVAPHVTLLEVGKVTAQPGRLGARLTTAERALSTGRSGRRGRLVWFRWGGVDGPVGGCR